MPDIAMCKGDGCPKQQMCYRYTAKSSDYQSFFTTPPIKEDGTCEYYWDNKTYANDTTKGLPEEDSKRRAWHY